MNGVKVKNYYDIGGKKEFMDRFIYSDKLEHLIAVQGFDQIYFTTLIIPTYMIGNIKKRLKLCIKISI